MKPNIKDTLQAIKKISAKDFKGSIGNKVFTISDCYGSGGEEITELLAKRLNLTIYSEDIITGVAELTGSDREAVQMVDEGIGKMKDFWLYRLVSGKNFSHNSFKRHLVNVIFSLARLGNCIIVGRGGHVVLAHSAALRVRITSSVPCCAERIMVLEGVKKETAFQKAKETKGHRGKFLWDMFKSRLNDPTQFDITISTDRVTEDDYEAIVDMIMDAYKMVEEREKKEQERKKKEQEKAKKAKNKKKATKAKSSKK